MFSFKENGKLNQFQKFNNKVYGLPDDRLYSIWDLLTQTQRFSMKALKGIRKGDHKKIKINLLISFSWLTAISSRLHINVEEELWKRFPMICSYCGKIPCVCKDTKPKKRKSVKINNRLKPTNFNGFQKMFAAIYPPSQRTLSDAGVHLAEELGEISEAIHNFLGEHKQEQFEKVKLEIADFTSCIFGVANSADINVAKELSKIFYKNCHVCHKAPCICNFTKVSCIKT